MDINNIRRIEDVLLEYCFRSPRQVSLLDETKKNDIEKDFINTTRKLYKSGITHWDQVLSNNEDTVFKIDNQEFALAFISTMYSERLRDNIERAIDRRIDFQLRFLDGNMKAIERKIETTYLGDEEMTLELLKLSNNPHFMLRCFKAHPQNAEIAELAKTKFHEYFQSVCSNIKPDESDEQILAFYNKLEKDENVVQAIKILEMKMEAHNPETYERFRNIETYLTKENILDALKVINEPVGSVIGGSKIWDFLEVEACQYIDDPNFAISFLEALPKKLQRYIPSIVLIQLYKLHPDNEQLNSVIDKCKTFSLPISAVSSKDGIVQALESARHGNLQLSSEDMYIINYQIEKHATDKEFIVNCYKNYPHGMFISSIKDCSVPRYYLELPEGTQAGMEEILKYASVDMLLYFVYRDQEIHCSSSYENHPSHGVVGKAGTFFIEHIDDRNMVESFLSNSPNGFYSYFLEEIYQEISGQYKEDAEITEKLSNAIGENYFKAINSTDSKKPKMPEDPTDTDGTR